MRACQYQSVVDKDAVARVVVELIKREWPQQWPSLLQELDTLCTRGETQTELVMFVLLRYVTAVGISIN